MSEKIVIGMAGFGTVGKAVYTILQRNKDLIESRCGKPIEIKTVVCRHTERARSQLSSSVTVSDNSLTICQDPEINTVIEVMGGIEPAKTLILKSLEGGKNVVTANKALLATHGEEIFAQAKKFNRSVFFEASVAGGIPIIKALREGLCANRIRKITGILNGTCNFILSSMHQKPISFDEALKEAQKLGYAEADPTFDIEGFDTGHKLTILSALAFGTALQFKPENVCGISSVTQNHIKMANEMGYVVKLLATAEIVDQSVRLSVAPTLIPKDTFLANVNGSMNAVQIESDALGTSLYYGAGAGGEPTASAVLADICDIARKHHCTSCSTEQGQPLTLIDKSILKFEHFIVLDTDTHLCGFKDLVETVFKDESIRIKQISTDQNNLALITEPCHDSSIENALKTLNQRCHQPLSSSRFNVENSRN
ncbi:homoserine dehydrogenase [Parasutterella secunda]|uniref:Homoserine dehydrogenase n=1 Tax=Parasutterella secunda TaxID=626947 RepID=A0ABS2GVF8_9BURK|nr:homoserine dehydrogenase [Parasutterella secunda]MBM6929206.1 homoserine dehydrogenase [Parasutterella secunda]